MVPRPSNSHGTAGAPPTVASRRSAASLDGSPAGAAIHRLVSRSLRRSTGMSGSASRCPIQEAAADPVSLPWVSAALTRLTEILDDLAR
jgi:hypothetical protein